MNKLIFALLIMLCACLGVHAQPLPLIDAHIHYSEDAWAGLPTAEAIDVLRRAGLKKAFVSSSSDDGTQKLYRAAPNLIIPVLRPYRRRGEIGSWFRDETVIAHVEARLRTHVYAGIGEFHIFGEDADLPVFRRIVALAKQYQLFLHAHADADAVKRIFAQDPEARVLWAHAGFAAPDTVRDMLKAHPRLWCDLAFRSEHADDGKVEATWKQLFLDFPERFMIGTDTYVPERWYYVVEHAEWTRQWLGDLPAELAANIAFRNAERLQAAPCDGTTPQPPWTQLTAPTVALRYRFLPDAVAVSQPLGLEVVACPEAGAAAPEQVRVDARMPAHGHGMNYRPQATQVAAGHYRFDGLMLHMPGQWQLQFDVMQAGQRTRLTADLELQQ